MFCHKCGSQIADGASFCHKCGAKMMSADTTVQTPTTTAVTSEPRAASISTKPKQPHTHDVPSGTPKKKKSMKLPIILGAVALVVVVIIVIAMNWNGKIDYEATVRVHQPFVSQGTSLTYGEVLDKYISFPNWEVRKSGEVNYVDISGNAKETDKDLVVTIKVVEDLSDPDLASISPESVTIDDVTTSTENDAVEFLLAMFLMYEEGYDNVSDLFSETAIPSENQSPNTVDVNYEGVSLSQLLYLPADEVIALLGPPMVHDEYKLAYDTIEFDLDGGRITGAESFNPEKFLISGTPLAQNRSLLPTLLGEPTHEGEGGSGYEMTFEQNGYVLTIATDGKDGAVWRIIISPSDKNRLIPSNYDDAYRIAQAWLDTHPAMATPYEPTTIRESSDVMFAHNGEEYYRFYLNGYHWLNILVHSKTGELLCAVYEESDDQRPPEIERLDDYYNKYFSDAQSTSSGEVLYKGISLYSFIGKQKDEVAKELEAPVSDAWTHLSYDDIYFGYQDGTGEILYIGVRPNACEINGATLEKDRAGLIGILGNPVSEVWESGEFQRNFIQSNWFISFSFTTDDVNEVASQWIMLWPNNEEDYGSSDEKYQEQSNNIDSSSPLTADGNTLSVGSLVYAKQNVFGVSVNYVRGYVTSIDNAGSVSVQWDTLLENRLWAYDECAILSDSSSPSGYSYYSSASGKQIPLAGVKFNLSANELYSKMP